MQMGEAVMNMVSQLFTKKTTKKKTYFLCAMKYSGPRYPHYKSSQIIIYFNTVLNRMNHKCKDQENNTHTQNTQNNTNLHLI